MKKATKDLPAKKPTTVKGGLRGPGGQDNMTLVRGAKPAKKDLSAQKDIKAGKKKY